MILNLRFLVLVPLVSVVLSGCVKFIVVDRLDTFVLMSFSGEIKDIPECLSKVELATKLPAFAYPCNVGPASMQPGGTVKLWIKAVNSRDVNTPMHGIAVSFDLTNTDGAKVADGVIEPNIINTGADGQNHESITIRIEKPGVYLVRARFNDRASQATAYSSPVIVQGE